MFYLNVYKQCIKRSVKSLVPVLLVRYSFVTTYQVGALNIRRKKHNSAHAAKNNFYGCLSTPVIEHEKHVR